MEENLIYYGGEVKMLGEDRVGGYLVRFSGPEDPDLVGDFFTSETEFGTNETPPVLYHHGLDGTLKNRIIGKSQWKIDDVGVWVEAQLNMRDEYESHIKEMIEAGKLGWSSGAVGHAVDRESVGKAYHIKTWIIGEASLTPTPAEPRNSAIPVKSLLPDQDDEAEQAAPAVESDPVEQEPEEQPIETKSTTKEMENVSTTASENTEVKNVDTTAQGPLQAAPQVDVDAIAAKAAEEAVKAFQASQAASREVKFEGSAPAVITNTNTHKYDRYSVQDLALTASVIKSSSHLPNARPVSTDMYAALAARLEGNEGNTDTLRVAQAELKSWMGRNGIKANEIHQSTLASGGDEWVGVAYSSDIWNVVRQEAMVVGMLPQFEFPAGSESMVIPLESTDPTWYKVAQSSALSSNPGGIPTNTVTSSKLTTANKTMTLSKMGARSLWTGELSEDAVLPFANQLREQFAVSGAEYLESAFLDGDTETGATANINDIAGTPASTDYFLSFDGPRKLALVTNTANSRDAGVLSSEDFLETAKLMGVNGRNAIDKTKVKFIIDNSTHYKALQLADVKTRDVNSAATVESGNLVRVYGYDVHVSGHMCKAGSGLSDTAGKIDVDTTSNNTKGQILAIRPDQWRFGYRRNMTLESTRVPAADATEIVALMRYSFNYRDTEAAAISYNVTV